MIGAGTDAYVSYNRRGGLYILAHTLEAVTERVAMFRRPRMPRDRGGIVDVTPDRSPIVGKTTVHRLYANCGRGTGGFKAPPGAAHLFARGAPQPINAPFTIGRFRDGVMSDGAAAAAAAH